MGAIPLPLDFPPGIQRDGTRVDSDRSPDALWCRWRSGRPRKMLGYDLIYGSLGGIPRKIHEFYQGGNTIIHIGTSKTLEQVVIDANGNFVSHADRTPTGFGAGPDVGWDLDALFDTLSSTVQLIAHYAPDLEHVASTTRTRPFIGDITSTVPLLPVPGPGTLDGGIYTIPLIAGGIVCVQPYLFDFDVDGFIGWSAPNNPSTLGLVGGTSGAGSARVSAQKIIRGMPLRGGGVNSPAALFWSLSEVITASFVGSANGIFAFNTVSPSSSILSTSCVIEYDGLYFWPGVDRFLVYNGTVAEVKNDENLDWFFDNINRQFAAKSYAFKVPRFGEIWFCAPLFENTEPSHAVIYNIRDNVWYDTELPNGGRTAGYFAQGFPHPIMGGNMADADGYKLWLHEKGYDQTGLGPPTPIRSYFETPFFGGPMSKQPADEAISIQQLEPDLLQRGDVSVYVVGGGNPKSAEFAGETKIIKAAPGTYQEQLTPFKEERRYARLHVESNTLGGYYQLGRSLLHTDKGDSYLFGKVGTPLTNG